jgi:outer membrane protein assembly factor BamB
MPPGHLALALTFTLTLPALALDWPGWRGPKRDDHQPETGLLQQWPEGGPKRLWMFQNAGMGYAGFSVVGGKLFTIGTRDDQEQLLAFDAATGKELWATPISGVFANRWGDGPRSTPTVDGDRVYALSGQGTLLCAQVADGKSLWTHSMRDLGGKTPGWGYTESPLVDGDKVVVTPGGPQGAIAAFDKKTGKVLWQSKDFTDGAQYSSLMPAKINKVPQYVQLTMQSVVGIASKDGSVVWRTEWPGKTAVIPTPIVRDNFVFVTSGYGVGCRLIEIGPNGPTEVYRNENMINHHGGVVLVGEHLYGYSDKSGWTCLDFKTGQPKWVENNKLKKGAIAYAGGRLYLLEEKTGTVVLLEPSPEAWSEKGRFRLDPQTSIRAQAGAIWTHPVVANGRLYLRDQDHIYCYAVK